MGKRLIASKYKNQVLLFFNSEMEHENLSINWVQVLMQWVMFFALLTVIFFPAFKFRNLAREYNRKGWLYFFLGMAVGIFGFNLGHLIGFPLRSYVVPKEYEVYTIWILFLSAALFYWFSYKFLEKYFMRNMK